jgi:hypothetical protein
MENRRHTERRTEAVKQALLYYKTDHISNPGSNEGDKGILIFIPCILSSIYTISQQMHCSDSLLISYSSHTIGESIVISISIFITHAHIISLYRYIYIYIYSFLQMYILPSGQSTDNSTTM